MHTKAGRTLWINAQAEQREEEDHWASHRSREARLLIGISVQAAQSVDLSISPRCNFRGAQSPMADNPTGSERL